MAIGLRSKFKTYSVRSRLVAGVALSVFALGGTVATLPVLTIPAFAQDAALMPSFADLVQKVRKLHVVRSSKFLLHLKVDFPEFDLNYFHE